ncbi:MAG: 3-keto-5-aminohexanoate cleavage protein [Caldilineaceae bacterium]
MSPHLPFTPNDIVEQAVAAHAAGAAVLHLHARDPQTGAPTPDVELFRDYVARIKPPPATLLSA